MYKGVYSNNDIKDFRTSEMEVRKLCSDIDITKSSALDGINLSVLKDAFFMFPTLGTTIFPNEWKLTTVTPLSYCWLSSTKC